MPQKRASADFLSAVSHWVLLVLALLTWWQTSALPNAICAAQPEQLDFARDIQPILNEHCLDCHSGESAEAGLALDSQLEALRGGDSGEAAIVPGEALNSYLIQRVMTDDEAERMPPDGEPLSAEHIEMLQRWINDESTWTDARQQLGQETLTHWSFQPLARPPLPGGGAQAASLQPVDAFVWQSLRAQSLDFSPPAERRRLVRRLYLVMHGVPPTLSQVENFVTDQRPDAWERLIEEVLSSPRYGERWGNFWLDLVRFGETTGFETNRERPHAWRYRDWVIKAFNEDKPYNEFILEQLAGDALGAPLGTGFLVAGPNDIVKGRDKLLGLMQREDELADILNTTGTAFLGLTVGCARCHNHKFDPISQTDYYSLQAVFAGVNHGDRQLAAEERGGDKLSQITSEIAELETALAEYRRQPQQAQVAAADGSPPPVARPAVNAKLNDEFLQPVMAKHIRFTISATNASQPCLDELEIFSRGENVALATAGATPSSGGDFEHPFHKLEHINDGRFGNARSWIAAQDSGGWVQISLPAPKQIDHIRWARDREGNFADRVAVDYKIEVSLDGQQWQLVASDDDRHPPGTPPEQISDYVIADAAEAARERLRKQLARLTGLRRERDDLTRPITAYVGTFSQPGPTHRLYRGEPTAPRETVLPAAISSLSDLQLPADTPERERRLAVARWIAADDNPLTPRVLVNRLWQHHFGTGIVDTPSDFGTNGTPPSHPELLDWLAAEFVASGWSLKHIHRLLLRSRTWQQDSRPRESAIAVDAASRLLWRFPPRRLEAEAIRDSILAVTDKLRVDVGGPGFSAFEVEQENVRHYFPKKSFGPADWRRMVYMTKVRQERDAVFGVFDCPDFNQVVPKRSRSTTPLQALNLLNSNFVLQQATFFVDRLAAMSTDDAQRVRLAYQFCCSREPENHEVESALKFIAATNWTQFARAMLNANEFVFIP
ncbi:DUF1553 domain-containing protein [Planctomycetaceae bacterium SH139]